MNAVFAVSWTSLLCVILFEWRCIWYQVMRECCAAVVEDNVVGLSEEAVFLLSLSLSLSLVSLSLSLSLSSLSLSLSEWISVCCSLFASIGRCRSSSERLVEEGAAPGGWWEIQRSALINGSRSSGITFTRSHRVSLSSRRTTRADAFSEKNTGFRGFEPNRTSEEHVQLILYELNIYVCLFYEYWI